jgi:transcriptional regulator GlxA family with amidase domain
MAIPTAATGVRVSHRVVVVVFPRVQSLDVVGAVEVFADANRQAEALGLPFAYEIQVVAPIAGPIETSSGIPIVASASLDQITGPLDTLLIGSGRGAREAVENVRLIAAIRRLAMSAPRVVSVCTGAFPLAATGLLDGRRAATHWARCQEFAQKFPSVTVDPDAIYVTDGKFHTSAGGTASIDLALALVESDLGRATALASACQLVVYLRRPGGQAQFSSHLMIQIERGTSDRLSALLRWMIEHLDQKLSVEQLASRAAMSPRNFARRFRSEMGATPAQYLQRLRLDAARRLLTEGDLPTDQIAARCGFGARETMRLAFQRHLRVAPQQFRERFRHPEPEVNRTSAVLASS